MKRLNINRRGLLGVRMEAVDSYAEFRIAFVEEVCLRPNPMMEI